MGPLDKYILNDNAIKATKAGFELQFQSHWYRSLPLSCMDFKLKINGENIENNKISIVVNGNKYAYAEMQNLDKEWLFILDKATLLVQKQLNAGKKYEVEFNLDLNIPYILVGPESKPLLASSVVKKMLICQVPQPLVGAHNSKIINSSTDKKATKMPPQEVGRLKLATSLFSYAYEWNSGQYSLEDIFAKTKEIALGNGLEMIGFQSFKDFPYLSEKQISETKSLFEKYEFTPVCLDANVDIGLRRNHPKSIDEIVEYLKPQIMAAKSLGFPVLRVQMMAKPEVLRKLVAFAEKENVRLGMELHTPYSVDNPAVIALRELYEEIDSPYLGFIPDMGTCMREITPALLNSFKAVGVTDEMIEITKIIWNKDVPMPAKFGELNERISALGGTLPQIGRLNMALSMNGRQPIEMWKEIIPRTVHIHGKFYGFDENGDEPSIDYATILKIFNVGGYSGYISSEYEGSAFTDEFSAFDMVAKQHKLFKKILREIENEG